MLDSDGSGTMTKEELIDGIGMLGIEMEEKDVIALFEAADTDGDGVLTIQVCWCIYGERLTDTYFFLQQELAQGVAENEDIKCMMVSVDKEIREIFNGTAPWLDLLLMLTLFFQQWTLTEVEKYLWLSYKHTSIRLRLKRFVWLMLS